MDLVVAEGQASTAIHLQSDGFEGVLTMGFKY